MHVWHFINTFRGNLIPNKTISMQDQQLNVVFPCQQVNNLYVPSGIKLALMPITENALAKDEWKGFQKHNLSSQGISLLWQVSTWNCIGNNFNIFYNFIYLICRYSLSISQAVCLFMFMRLSPTLTPLLPH